MREIILPGKVSRKDLARCRRNEKECVAARDRRIHEFPLSNESKCRRKGPEGGGMVQQGNDRLLYWISRQTAARKGRVGEASADVYIPLP